MMTPDQHRAAVHGLCIAPQAFRKISDRAENRMRTRTAKQQLADALAASEAERKPTNFPTPDDDGDDSAMRNNILK